MTTRVRLTNYSVSPVIDNGDHYVLLGDFKEKCYRWNKWSQNKKKVRSVEINFDIFGNHQKPIRNMRGDLALKDRELDGIPYGESFPRDPLTISDIRRMVFGVIDECQYLRFHLFTKSPSNVRQFWPKTGDMRIRRTDSSIRVVEAVHRQNVLLFGDISDQRSADTIIPLLLECDGLCRLLGVNIDPLFEEITISSYLKGISWVVASGATGKNAKPCNVDVVRHLRDQCKDANVAFYLKRLGNNPRPGYRPSDVTVRFIKSINGSNLNEWPEDVRMREFPKIDTM